MYHNLIQFLIYHLVLVNSSLLMEVFIRHFFKQLYVSIVIWPKLSSFLLCRNHVRAGWPVTMYHCYRPACPVVIQQIDSPQISFSDFDCLNSAAVSLLFLLT